MIIIVFCQFVREQLSFFISTHLIRIQGSEFSRTRKFRPLEKWSGSDELGKKSLAAHVLGNRKRIMNIYDIDRCTVPEVQVFFVITSRENETISPLFLSFSFMFWM